MKNILSMIKGDQTMKTEDHLKKLYDLVYKLDDRLDAIEDYLGDLPMFVPYSQENGDDALLGQAIKLVRQHDKASASLLQRGMSIGYARAARILDQLEKRGVVGPAIGSRPRRVLGKDKIE